MKWIPCAAHLMNLVVSSSLVHVKNLIKRAAILVRYFKKSSILTDDLLKTVAKLQNDPNHDEISDYTSLKQRNNTRWNSVYDMIFSLVQNKVAIIELLGEKTVANLPNKGKHLKNWKVNLKEEQWESLNELKDILLPFKMFTKTMSLKSRPSISMLLPLITKLIRDLESQPVVTFSPCVKKVVSSLSIQIKKRFEYLDDPLFLQATLMDPSTKGFLSEIFKTEKQSFIVSADAWCKKNDIQLEIATAIDDGSWLQDKLIPTNSPTSLLLDTRWRLGFAYLPRDILSHFNNSEHPLHYKSLYVKYCGIPAASVEVERLWSRAGQIYSDKRNRMSDETLSCELFLKMNNKIQDSGKAQFNSQINDFKTVNTSDLSNTLLSTGMKKVFLPSEGVDEEDAADASDIDCQGDQELQLIVEEENDLSECDFESERSSEEEADFWGRSKAPKNFNNNIHKLLSNKRKRTDTVAPLANEARQKRMKRTNQVRWIPQLGDFVSVAYEEDCKCNLGLTACKCENVWFQGTVISDLIYDTEKILGRNIAGFNVKFHHTEDDYDHVEFEKGGTNERWVLNA
jgi:hypothetical protein